MRAYLFRQPISFCLRHPHQLLSEGVNSPLCGGFLRVDCRFIIEGPFIEINEVGSGSSLPVRAVLGVVSHLSAFEAGVVIRAWCGLSNAVSRCSPLPPPLVRGSGAAEVHGYWAIVESGGGCGRVHRRRPISDRVSVSGGVRWSPSPHILLGALEE